MDKNRLYEYISTPTLLDSLRVEDVDALYILYPQNPVVINFLIQFKNYKGIGISEEEYKKFSVFLPMLQVRSLPSLMGGGLIKVEQLAKSIPNVEDEEKEAELEEESVMPMPNALSIEEEKGIVEQLAKSIPNVEDEEKEAELEEESVMPMPNAVVEEFKFGRLTNRLSNYTLWLKKVNDQSPNRVTYVYYGDSRENPIKNLEKKIKNRKRKKNKKSNNQDNNLLYKEDYLNKKDNKRLKSVIEFANKSLLNPKDILSETLAELYLQQGHIHKALEQYKRLSLAFPEKSAYFAELIKNLENK